MKIQREQQPRQQQKEVPETDIKRSCLLMRMPQKDDLHDEYDASIHNTHAQWQRYDGEAKTWEASAQIPIKVSMLNNSVYVWYSSLVCKSNTFISRMIILINKNKNKTIEIFHKGKHKTTEKINKISHKEMASEG